MSEQQHDDNLVPRIPPPPLIPLIDPTANVLSLVKEQIDHQNELRALNDKLHESDIRRLDELRVLTKACAEEIAAVHLLGNRELAVAETKRIDALLLATKADAATVAEKSAAQAAVLVTAQANSAEVLRAQLTTLRESLEKRLQLLEQSQYAIGGRDTQRSESRQGGQWGIGIVVAIGFGLFSFLLGVAGLAITLAKG